MKHHQKQADHGHEREKAGGQVKTPLTLNEIRDRVYQKWEAAGKPEGDGVRFWLEAESELLQRKR